MEAWSLDELRTARESLDRLYHEFLRVSTMSVGYYRLPAGGIDPQSPHLEDEVYVVVGGRARVTVGGDEREDHTGRHDLRRRQRAAPLPRHRRGSRADRRLRTARDALGRCDLSRSAPGTPYNRPACACSSVDRADGFGPSGRGFESCRARQNNNISMPVR